MDYHARFYSPALGRFTQPDTVIPGATNTQSWNRYSYTFNNPILYNDPSGHSICSGDGWCLGDYLVANPGLSSRMDEPFNDPQAPPLSSGTNPASSGGATDPAEDDGETDTGASGDILEEYDITVKFYNMSQEDMIQFYVELLWILYNASPEFIENYMRGMVFRVRRVDSDGRGSISYFPVPIIKIKNDYQEGTSTHEIWHQIDYHSGRALSTAFETYVGSSTYYEVNLAWSIIQTGYDTGFQTPPSYGEGVPNRREDFAESVEEYFGYPGVNILDTELRWGFINELLTTGNIPQP